MCVGQTSSSLQWRNWEVVVLRARGNSGQLISFVFYFLVEGALPKIIRSGVRFDCLTPGALRGLVSRWFRWRHRQLRINRCLFSLGSRRYVLRLIPYRLMQLVRRVATTCSEQKKKKKKRFHARHFLLFPFVRYTLNNILIYRITISSSQNKIMFLYTREFLYF